MKFFLIVIITLGAIGSIALIYRLSHKLSPTVKPEEWQTYKNTRYGFSFQYPPNLTVNEPSTAHPGDLIDATERAESITLLQKIGYSGSFTVYITSDTMEKNENLETYVKRTTRWKDGYLETSKDPYDITPKQKVLSFDKKNIQGREIIVMISQVLPDQGAAEDIIYKAFIEYQSGKVLIYFDPFGQFHDIKIDDQIVSTIKF